MRILVGLVFLLLVSNVVGARTETDLTAEGIHASGVVTVEGQLRALLMEDGTISASTPVPGFVLTAPALHLETDSSDPAIHTGLVGAQGVTNVTIHSTPRDVFRPVLSLASSRPGHRVNVYAQDARVVTEGGCMKLGASGDGQVVRKFRVYPRPDFVTDVSSATLLQPCGAGNVTIQGDFVLSVWEADLTLTSDGKTEELRTGSLPASDASSADARPYAAHDQEIYVFAHNATMRLSSLSGLAYVGQPGIQAAGQVDLEGASGRLTVAGVAAVVSGAKVQMAGSAIAVRADGEAPSHPLSILVAGDVGSVAVDGQPLAAASTTLLGQPTYWIWVLLAAGGALVLWRARPLLVFYGMTLRGQSTGSTEPHATKERVGAGWWVMASRAYKRGRLARASRLAEKGRRAFPRSLDLEFLKGMVALNKMDGQTAFGVFSGLHGKVPSGAERCRMACLCAEAALVDGREEMALDWLRRAASDHFPTFRAELADARFDDLAGYGWFASMRRVSAPLAPDPAFG